MQRARRGPMFIHVFTKVSDLISNAPSWRWLMIASVDFGCAVSERPREQVNAFKRLGMQLHQDALPQPKRSLLVVDERSDYFEGKLSLPNAVFGFAASSLVGDPGRTLTCSVEVCRSAISAEPTSSSRSTSDPRPQ